MSSTTQRDLAMRAAPHDFVRALRLAREVSQPWFACQALAGVARFAPKENVVPVAREALKAAFSDSDSYRQVAATAWPLRALIEREFEGVAQNQLPEILKLSREIANPVSRSDALFLLWESVFPVQPQGVLLDELVASCQNHFKADALLRDTVLILASRNPQRARKLAEKMPDGKAKRQALKRLEAGEICAPRAFFWRDLD